MKNNRINVRLDDNLFSNVSNVSDRFGLNKSEVIRLALRDDLAKLNQTPIAKLGVEAREEFIQNTQDILNKLQTMQRAVNWSTNNLNQLTKLAHEGKNLTIDEGYFKQYSADLNKLQIEIQNLKDEVSKGWRLLV